MTFWPVLAFWVVAIAGLYGSSTILLYALLAFLPFASLAVVPPELTQGLTLTPAPMVAMLIVVKCLARRDGRRWVAAACTTPGLLAQLFAFWLVAVLTTVFAPYYFAGEVEVIPLRGEVGEASLLAPSLQQFSQLGYMTVSVFAVMACARLLVPPQVRQHALRAMALGAVLLCITGLLDWLARTIDLEWLLAPLRTATYSIATDSVIGNIDMKRVSGVTPEPAVFGSLCVTYMATLWFFRRAMRDRWMRVAAPVLCLCLGAMVWLSTSTTAYVGFALLIVIAIAETTWRLIVSRRRSAERRTAWSHNRRLGAIVLGIVLAFVAFPEAYVRLAEVVDSVVLKKVESSSYDERSMWTAVSLQSTIDTNGFGVGLGGTRASNSAVAMLSNVGVLGTLLYVGFLAATYLHRPSKRAPDGPAWITAYRWSVPAIIAPGLMAGTTADFGPYLALLFGSTVALQAGRRTEQLLERGAEASRRARRRGRRRRRVGGFLLPAARSAPQPIRGLLVDFVVRSLPLFDLGDPDSDPEPDSGPAGASVSPAATRPTSYPVAGGVDVDLGDELPEASVRRPGTRPGDRSGDRPATRRALLRTPTIDL